MTRDHKMMESFPSNNKRLINAVGDLIFQTLMTDYVNNGYYKTIADHAAISEDRSIIRDEMGRIGYDPFLYSSPRVSFSSIQSNVVDSFNRMAYAEDVKTRSPYTFKQLMGQ